jgi:hypothetical protein
MWDSYYSSLCISDHRRSLDLKSDLFNSQLQVTITVYGATQSAIHYGTHQVTQSAHSLVTASNGRHPLLLAFQNVPVPKAKQFQANQTSVTSQLELSWCHDRRSVGLSVYVSGTPFGPMIRFFFFLPFAGQLLCSSSWGALSDERTCL